MAANYWESTQRKHWLFTREQLEEKRAQVDQEDPELVEMYTLPDVRLLSIYFNQQITRLGKRLGVRQQALATAQVYVRRFYTEVQVRQTNPYLVVATAVYLACKMEECPHHIRLVVSEGRSLWPEHFVNDTVQVGECEFWLISEMHSQMIVHHPYRMVTTMCETFELAPDESSLAWSIINDQYGTDLTLLYPPHLIAVVAILMALVLRPSPLTPGGTHSPAAVAQAASSILANAHPSGIPKIGMTKVQRFAKWLAESTVDIEGVIDCVQEIISLYEVQEYYNEKLVREQINRVVKARGLDR